MHSLSPRLPNRPDAPLSSLSATRSGRVFKHSVPLPPLLTDDEYPPLPLMKTTLLAPVVCPGLQPVVSPGVHPVLGSVDVHVSCDSVPLGANVDVAVCGDNDVDLGIVSVANGGVSVVMGGESMHNTSDDIFCSTRCTSVVRQNAHEKDVPSIAVLSSGGTMNAASPPLATSAGLVGCSAAPSSITSKPWSSLFTSLPRNAGVYEPVEFDIVEENGVMIPPPIVMQAGIDFWSEYLVGFFLDPKQRLLDASAVCRKAWRLRGNLRVKLVDSMYFLLFSSPEDRSRVLEAEPSFFDGKPFIITPWSPTVASAREQVLSIPVWVYFSHIPSALQSLLGLNWIACNVGKLKCFDSNTVARDKLVYAKALIEISPFKPLPSSIPVQLAVGHVVDVRVRYGWVPDICTICHSFGHLDTSCLHSAVSPAPPKIPLPRPPLRIWVPKVPVPPPDPFSDPDPPPTHARPSASVPGDFTSDALVVPDPSLPHVVWAETESCWVDLRSDMRFNPVDKSYFRYVSDNPLDDRCLYYSPSGDSLVLDLDGSYAGVNSVVLADSSWDRSFIYSSDAVIYDPSLAVLFRPYFGLLGNVSSQVDDVAGVSYSSEQS
jgi:hypothetical protein